ncbi:glutathione hydrolase 1 proenzyme-like [Physella acuta]|uniref:glutathione hydrolase 1 proenzyme-like n=1 Tax=Physella acuta TaxID=109671 RepID=UPI0027DADD5C|nr:glutathione hydrolase 1 proenzyme-like [Physella acuta]
MYRKQVVKYVIGGVMSLLLAAVVVLLVVFFTQSPDASASQPVKGNHFYRQAAIAADSAQCSTIGKDILLKGGNAVDAAIAALLCNGLACTQSMGIGGGFFMTIYNRTTGVPTVIDARETAPGRATADMYAGRPEASLTGGLSIAVPGEIKGYWYAHQKYGRLPWSDLFQPAIKMAAEGFPVTPSLGKIITSFNTMILQEASLREVFLNNQTGELFKEGEIMTRPKLANTLRVISREGMTAFYNGSLTDDILQDLQDIGAIISREDLFNYTVRETSPTEVTLNDGIRVLSPGTPSGGPVLAFILNILNGYYFKPKDVDTEEKRALTYHRMVEAFKFAYAKRTALGDGSFVDVAELLHNMSSKDYADSIRRQISDTKTFDYVHYGPTFYSPSTGGTSHISVVDGDGSAVSVTSTINGSFGSKRRGMRTGIIFNNEMDDFSSPNITNLFGFQPSPANFIAPGKRPLSSMSPSIFVERDGQVTMVIGASGGSRITTSTAWVAAHSLWLGDSIKDAIFRPRLHHQLVPDQLEHELGFQQNVVTYLRELGHTMKELLTPKSAVQGIRVIDGAIFAESDHRKGGVPDGY